MFKVATLLSTIILSTVSMGVECTAYDRYIDQDRNVIETKKKLEKIEEQFSSTLYAVELAGYSYFLTYDKVEEDGLLQIINSSDETKGIVSRSAFGKRGRISLALIDGNVVRRIECFLKP